jgi:hypothetical protein
VTFPRAGAYRPTDRPNGSGTESLKDYDAGGGVLTHDERVCTCKLGSWPQKAHDITFRAGDTGPARYGRIPFEQANILIAGINQEARSLYLRYPDLSN